MLLLGYYAAQAGEVAAAGSFDLLQSEILTGSQASVTFSSLGDYATDYQHLQIRYVARGTDTDNLAELGLQLNNVTTSSYSSHNLFGTGGGVVSSNNVGQTTIFAGSYARTNTTEIFGSGVIDILDPFSSSKNTTIRSLSGFYTTSSSFRHFIMLGSGVWLNTTAVSSIKLLGRGAENLAAGSRFSLYGLRKAA